MLCFLTFRDFNYHSDVDCYEIATLKILVALS